MAYRVGGLESQEEFEKKLREMFPEVSSYTVGEETRRFSARLVPLKNGATRIVISDAENPDTDSLYVDARPGAKIGNGQSSVILDYPDKGSKHKRVITNEVYFNTEKPIAARGDIKTRTPFEVLRDSLYGAYFVSNNKAVSIQSKFNMLATRGDQRLQLVGGWQDVSPMISSNALQSLSRNVSVGFSRAVKNPEKLITKITSWINDRGNQPSPELSDFFRNMRGLAPSKEVDNTVRFRPVNESTPEANEYGDISFYHLGKLGKGLTATRNEREQLSETGMMTKDPKTGLLVPLAPKPITTMADEGTRRLNVQIGGDRAPAAMVRRNILATPGLPDSGAMVIFGEPGLEKQKDIGIGPFYDTQRYEKLHPATVSELERTSFEWGIFGKDKKGNWIKKDELTGYALAPKQKAVVGLKRIRDKSGNETVVPIRIQAENKETVLAGLPTLNIPPAINNVSDEFAPVSGRVYSSEGEYDAVDIPGERLQKIQKNMGGGEVSTNTISKVSLSFPIKTINTRGRKQLGHKESDEYEFGIQGEGKRKRNVHIGKQLEVELQGITASVKNPLQTFLFGQVGTMPTPKIRQLVSETYGEDSPLLSEIDKTIAYQEDLLKNKALSEAEVSEQWQGVDIEKLAMIQAEKTGNKLFASSPMAFVDDMRKRVLAAQEANPERYWNEYQMGIVETPEFVDVKTVDEAELDFQRQHLRDAIEEERKKSPGLYPEEQWESLSDENSPDAIYKFEQSQARKNLFHWNIKAFGILGSTASIFVTEHEYNESPRLHLEQMIALNRKYPKQAAAMMASASKLESPGNKAWGNMVTYFNSVVSNKVDAEGRPLVFHKRDYTTITPNQASEIATKLSTLEGNSPKLMQEAIEEVIGKEAAPLLRMEKSGAIFPTPKVVRGVSEMDVIDDSAVVNIDRFSRLYGPALSDFLADKPGSTAIKKFENTLISALTSTGGEPLKNQESIPAVGVGGKAVATAGVHPYGVVISDSRMRQLIRESLIAKNKIKENPVGRKELLEQRRLLNQAYAEVRKQGGLAGFYSKNPPYDTEHLMTPIMILDSQMLRDKGLKVPRDIRVNNGRFIYGGTANWGAAAGVGIISELTMGDMDIDPAEVYAAQEWEIVEENGKKRIKAIGMDEEPYKGLLEKTGREITEHVTGTIRDITGKSRAGGLSAYVKEGMALIEASATPLTRKAFIEENKLSLTTQEAAGEAGLTTIKLKAEMGKSFNVRRRFDSVMEVNPDITDEDQAKQYSALGLSYAKNLEFGDKIPLRRYEQMIQTLTPYYNDKEQGVEPHWELQWKEPTKELRFGRTASLDVNELEPTFSSYTNQDIRGGILNPESALFAFARSSEEYHSMLEEYRGTLGESENPDDENNMADAVQTITQKHREEEGYDFSQTVAGQVFSATLIDKLKGTAGPQYRLPKGTSVGGGERAINFMMDAPIKWNGEVTTVGEIINNEPLNVANTLYKAMKRKTGILLPEEVADIGAYKRQLMKDKKQPKTMLDYLAKRFDADAVHRAMTAEGVHDVKAFDLERFQNYKPTPNELNRLLDPEDKYKNELYQNIFAKTQLGISDPGSYILKDEKWSNYGKMFENTEGKNVISDEGYTSTYSPKQMQQLGETGSTFNWEGGRYRIDLMGIDPKTGRFFIADYKWKATEAGAKEMLANPKKSLPQITSYADVVWRMAHPEKYLENWDEIKETLEGNPGETYFTNQIIESLRHDSQTKLTEDDITELKGLAPEWYHAIREFETISRKTFAGTGTGELNDPMHTVGVKDWGGYDELQALEYDKQSTEIMHSKTEQDLTTAASQFASAIEKAQQSGADVRQLAPPLQQKLDLGTKPRTQRGIPTNRLTGRAIAEKTDSGKTRYRGNAQRGGGGPGDEDNTNNLPPLGPSDNGLALERTLRQLLATAQQNNQYQMERWGPAEDAPQFSRRHYEQNILKERFLAGKAAAEDLLNRKEEFEKYPIDLVKETSQALLEVGATPSITYDEQTKQFISNGKVVSGDEANVLAIGDYSKTATANPVRYEEMSKKRFSKSKTILKEFDALTKATEAGQKLGITSETPELFKAKQQITEAQQGLPNASLAAAISLQLTSNPKNKPTGYISNEEGAQEIISNYERYKGQDVFSNLEKKLGELTSSFDKVIDSSDSLSKSKQVELELNGKKLTLDKKLVDAQEDIIKNYASQLDKYRDIKGSASSKIATAEAALQDYKDNKIDIEEAAKRISPAVTASRQAKGALSALTKIEQGAESTLEGEYPGAPPTISEGFRHAFGGFGLFYLKTLASYGFGSYQKGYEATVKQKTLENQLAVARYGAENVEPYESEELQRQRNLLIAGGNVWTNLQKVGNYFGKNTDITGSLLSGLGAYAATEHLAPMISGIGKTIFGASSLTPKIVGATAPYVGLAATVGMLGYSIYSNAVNYEDSIMQAAAQDDPYYKNQNLLSAYTLAGPKLKDFFRYTFTDYQGEGTGVFTGQKENYQWEYMLANDELATRQHYMLMPTDEQRKVFNSLAITGPAPLAGLTPEESLALLNRYTTGDINSWSAVNDYQFLNKVGNIGRAEAAGRNADLMSQQVAIATGMGYKEPGDLIDIANYYATLSGAEFTKSTIGMDLINRMPSVSRGLGGYLDKTTGLPKLDKLQEKLDALTEIVSGPLGDAYTQRLEVARNAATVGRVIDINEEDFALTSNPAAQSAQIFAQNALYDRQTNLSALLQNAGVNYRRANNFIDNFESAEELNFAERLLNFSPTAIGDYARGLAQRGEIQGAAYYDKFALTDYNLQGQQTGLGHWTTSLRGAASSAVQNANMIWGQGNWENSRVAQAAVYGINRDTGEIYQSQEEIPNGANVVAGQRGIQWQQYYQGIEYQNRQFGIQQRQIALQEQYQPMFWAQEDKQREFSYRQQEWSFSQQEASLEMQNRHFQQNMAFQQKQAYMQRGWAAEDWGYQDLTRSLQWGWKQEDFAEQSRFLTGRERKIAERGMERETTLYNLESGQIDKTRDRQKQMWALEDERFAIQKEQYAEQKQFQEEALAKQREFFEEQKRLTEESVTLNRQYQTEQIALQKESLALQMEYAAKQNETNKLLMEMAEKDEDMQAAFSLAKEKQLEFFNTAVEGFEYLGIEFKQMIQSIISGTPYEAESFSPGGDSGSGGGGGGGGGRNIEMPMAKGGDMFPGMAYIVGEAGAELVRPHTLGSVVNQYDIAQTLRQTDRWTNRSVFYPSNQDSPSSSGPQTINVYVGNEKLASFVLNTVKKDLEVL